MALSYSDYSATLSIIYFVVNIIFMFGLAFYVYKSGNHKLKSKSYIKDVWSQRKIFFPLIIHFYDTATDIGVIYNWSQLMKHEEDEDLNINYESVDMSTFFWCGIAFLIVYRVIMLMMALYAWLDEDEDGEWYHVLLVIIDLYIFLMVYESFSEANGVITKNAERKQKNAERKKQKRHEAIDKQLQVAVEMGQISTNEVKAIQIALNDELAIEPTERQMILQLIESITESMPQIVLQSVFIIRSANDLRLVADGSNIDLLLFSVFASLFSISNKFVYLDRSAVNEIARSLKPRRSFPDCIHYWYVTRSLWRLCHVLSKFVAFTLIWVVMGGAWLPIWVGTVYIFWSIVAMCISRVEGKHEKYKCMDVLTGLAGGIFLITSIPNITKQWAPTVVYKWIETTIAFTAITVFATVQFECTLICADSRSRMLFGTDNNRIFIYWIMGVAAHVMDGVLYSIMYSANIVSGAHVIYHNRWTEEFGLHEEGEQFKNFITDYENERITGIRMSVGANNSGGLKSFEFQINGIWRGRIGSHEPINEQELLLDADEYVNKARLKGLTGVHFFTNKGNVVEAGTLGEDEEGIVTLQGDFRLVDCKGTCDTE
eukprot:459867_1